MRSKKMRSLLILAMVIALVGSAWNMYERGVTSRYWYRPSTTHPSKLVRVSTISGSTLGNLFDGIPANP